MARTTSPDQMLVQPTDLAEAVTAALRELILSGQVSPGERLVETDLSAKFGTSRGPVRDAFKGLEEAGLVRSVPVEAPLWPNSGAADIDEIYTLRAALEGVAVERVANDPPTSLLASIDEALESIAEAHQAGDARASGEADMHFHRLIVAGAMHRRLRDAWERLGDQTLLLMTHLAAVAPQVQAAAGDHRVIADAIADADPSRARQALLGHLDQARLAIRTHYPTDPASPLP